MPATPKSTQITDALMAVLTSIRTSGGYHTDLGANVHRRRWYALADTDIPLPVLTLLPQTNAPTAAAGTERVAVRTYILEAVLPGGEAVDAEQDRAEEDIRRAVETAASGRKPLGGLAMEVTLGTATLEDPELGSDIAIVRLPLTVSYHTTRGA